MKKEILNMFFLCFLLIYCNLGYAAPQGYSEYKMSGIKIDIPYGTQVMRTNHFDKMNDDVISADNAILKTPNGLMMFISIMNRSLKYMSPNDTETTLPKSFKREVSLTFMQSLGKGKGLNVDSEDELKINELTAYLIIANQNMYNKNFTQRCYLFAKNNKVVNILYLFENKNPNSNIADDTVKKIESVIDTSVKGFTFE